MSYIQALSGTGVIEAVTTRKGRELITSNVDIFLPTHFAVADDDINYQLMNPDNIDQDDPDILALPVSEPSTNENNELLHKIWVDNTFLDQRFPNQTTLQAEMVKVTSETGDIVTLHSDDTSQKVAVWVTTLNNISRPYIADYYRFQLTSDVDYFTVEFNSPALTDFANKNYEIVKRNGEYIFSRINNDGSGKYVGTSQGSPSIVFTIKLVETPMLFADLQKPENRKRIYIPNFITITQIDSSKSNVNNVTAGSIPLEIMNVIF